MNQIAAARASERRFHRTAEWSSIRKNLCLFVFLLLKSSSFCFRWQITWCKKLRIKLLFNAGDTWWSWHMFDYHLWVNLKGEINETERDKRYLERFSYFYCYSIEYMDESVNARDQAPKSTKGKQKLRSIECQLKLGDAFTHMYYFPFYCTERTCLPGTLFLNFFRIKWSPPWKKKLELFRSCASIELHSVLQCAFWESSHRHQ